MNKVYINDNLREKLDMLPEYRLALFEAPTGYGKSSVLHTFLDERDEYNQIYISVLSEEPALIYDDLAEAFAKTTTKSCEGYSEKFRENPSDIKAFRDFLKNIVPSKETFIVIDNYQYAVDEVIEKLISVFDKSEVSDLHLVVLTDGVFSTSLKKLALGGQALLFTRDDFAYSRSDIVDFCELNSIKIFSESVNKIYKYSEGWLCFICLLLDTYKETGAIESGAAASRLIENILWSRIDESQKRAIISLSRLKQFSESQAKLLLGDMDIELSDLLYDNPFILYNDSTRKYRIHYILIKYCELEFEQFSISEKQDVIKATASIFESMGNNFEALKAYYFANDYRRILSLKLEMSDVYPYITSSNKEFFLSLIKDIPPQYKHTNYDFLMLMCMVLFLYNDRSNMLLLYNDIQNSIDSSEELSDSEKDILFGKLSYVRGYIEFNDIEYMTDKYLNAVNLIEGSISGNIDRTPWNFCVPSILHLYHKGMGELKSEVDNLERCMPFYYKISNGHGKGAEAVFSAESLFFTGDFNGAKIQCHKAAYMADSRNQVSISLSALLLLCKMDIINGKYDSMMANIAEFSTKYDFSDIHPSLKKQIIDFCESTIYMTIGEAEKISPWLTDWQSIEDNTNIISRSYANIIYGKYLLLTEQYEKLLGISSQFLGISAVYENIIPKIYTYIYTAIAYKAIGDIDSAMKMLRVAFDFAVDDNIIMPFVENSDYIEEIYSNIAFDKEYRDFLRKIKTLAKDYCSGIKSITKFYKNRDNYGLTSREMDVAKLAAKRLTNKEIADKLFIAESTVKSNMKVIFNKLNIASRTELADLF